MTVEKQIIENEEKLLEALKTKDLKTLDILLHDQLLFNIPNGETITKAMDLDAYSRNIMTVYSATASDQVIRPIDDTAIVSVIIDLKGKYEDQEIDGKFKYLRVWKLCDNQWKVIAGSSIAL